MTVEVRTRIENVTRVNKQGMLDGVVRYHGARLKLGLRRTGETVVLMLKRTEVTHVLPPLRDFLVHSQVRNVNYGHRAKAGFCGMQTVQ